MGCACSGEEGPIYSEAQLRLQEKIKSDAEGKWAWEVYEAWPVDGDATEVTLESGVQIKTWPITWDKLCEILVSAGVEEDLICLLEADTVGNDEATAFTRDSITWGAVQGLLRESYSAATGKMWVPQEHVEGPYVALLKTNTLKAKKEGFGKMLKELGVDAINECMWTVFVEWPCPLGDTKEITRYNRKKMAKEGMKVDHAKATWPLAFEGDTSITSMLLGCGWTEAQIASLKTELIDDGEANNVHPNCTEAEISWPDIQQAFRATLCDHDWGADENTEYPPLDSTVALRNKIHAEDIKEVIEGEYRMYCKPDEKDAFSYGLIIDNVDVEAGTFGGRSRKEGKYEVQNGVITYDDHSRVFLAYDEVWPGGTVDSLKARVKSNAKFQCESSDGYEQKATNETRNLPDDPDDRMGEGAEDGVKKYYLRDKDAAEDAGEEVEAAE